MLHVRHVGHVVGAGDTIDGAFVNGVTRALCAASQHPGLRGPHVTANIEFHDAAAFVRLELDVVGRSQVVFVAVLHALRHFGNRGPHLLGHGVVGDAFPTS